MSRISCFFIIALVLLNPGFVQSKASVFDSQGVEMVFVPGGQVKLGMTLDEAISFCKSLNSETLDCSQTFLTTLYAFIDHTTADVPDFYMDKYEVSVKDYIKCVEADICVLRPVENEFYSLLESPDLLIGDLPVSGINYYEAAIYCAWRQARLPTEAEWQYAAVGSNAYPFPWGEDTHDVPAKYCDGTCMSATNPPPNNNFRIKVPIDTYADGQSWSGIYNLSGNVAEWTSTWYSMEPSVGGDIRISKGGSYDSSLLELAVWLRTPESTLLPFRATGFRCVRTIAP
ncbi:MAG: SUMF1/EgtB/PvdO family nonheme iron enzyme [Chloroflexota bacterium]